MLTYREEENGQRDCLQFQFQFNVNMFRKCAQFPMTYIVSEYELLFSLSHSY